MPSDAEYELFRPRSLRNFAGLLLLATYLSLRIRERLMRSSPVEPKLRLLDSTMLPEGAPRRGCYVSGKCTLFVCCNPFTGALPLGRRPLRVCPRSVCTITARQVSLRALDPIEARFRDAKSAEYSAIGSIGERDPIAIFKDRER